MKDQVLLSITQVTDDETGMYSVGELDYSIPVSRLENYLKPDPIKRRNELFAQMGNLMVQVDRYAKDLINDNPQASTELK